MQRTCLITNLLVLGVLACSPQVKSGGTETIHNKQSASVSAGGGTVSIDNGSNVAVPAGAVAAGTQVTVQKVAPPAEFSASGSSQASTPVEVTGKGPDGQPVNQATQPMTIALVLTNANASLVDPTIDNLCVLAKAAGGLGLFVWRRNAIDYDDGTHTLHVKSLYFGTYEATYCGASAIAGGFLDASLQGATGEPKLSAAMTVPAGFDADLGAGRICLVVLRDEVKAKQQCDAVNQTLPPGTPPKPCNDAVPVLGVGDVVIQSGSSNDAKVEFPSTQVIDGDDHYVGVFLVDAGSACPVKANDDLSKVDKLPGVKSFYAFKIAPDVIKGGVKGTLGDTAGPYQFTSVNLALGGPGDLDSYTKFDESSVCLNVDLDNGHAVRLINFASGQIAGKKPFPVTLPTGTAGISGKADVRVRVGQDCGTALSDKLAGGDPKTGKPYWVTLHNAGTSLYLTPVTLHLTLSNAAEGAMNACLEIATPGGFGGGSPPIGRMFLSLGQPSFQVYLPYLADPTQQSGGLPKYDMQVTLLDAGGDCDNKKSSTPAITIPNKVLNPDIEVQL